LKKKGYFIALEGVDGCGKTTLSKKMVEIIDSSDFVYCSRKTIMNHDPFIEEQMRKVASLMWTHNSGILDHFLPKHYYIHLQAAWYSLLTKFVIKPLLKQDKTIIVDGWIYKFMARLLQQDSTNDYLRTIFSHIMEPDLILLLDVDIELIWSRKQDFKLYELGSHLGHENPNKTTFFDFQSRTWHNLIEFSKNQNWKMVRLSNSDVRHNAHLLLSHINEFVPVNN
jgi:dTMP kinase